MTARTASTVAGVVEMETRSSQEDMASLADGLRDCSAAIGGARSRLLRATSDLLGSWTGAGQDDFSVAAESLSKEVDRCGAVLSWQAQKVDAAWASLASADESSSSQFEGE